MNVAQHRAGSLLTLLLFLTLTSLSARAQEDTGTNYLAELHDFRLSNYAALDAYYRFSATTESETLDDIVLKVNEAGRSLEIISGSQLGVLSPPQVEQLNSEFESFKALTRENINVVRNTGYPDYRLSAELAEQAVVLNDLATELYQVALDSGETEINERIEAARSAAVTMTQMMTKYSARSHSAVSQAFQGSASEIALDEQARLFDQQLETIQEGPAEEELDLVLDKIESRWSFIRGSYINFNDRNVSFVIGRYSKAIIDGLDAAVRLIQSQDQP